MIKDDITLLGEAYNSINEQEEGTNGVPSSSAAQLMDFLNKFMRPNKRHPDWWDTVEQYELDGILTFIENINFDGNSDKVTVDGSDGYSRDSADVSVDDFLKNIEVYKPRERIYP